MAETKTSKRRVKNPETFRERAVKAAEGSEKPSRRGRVRGFSRKVFTPIFRPIGTASRKVASMPPFRWLRKPLRILGKVLLITYIRDSWKELKQVSWPDWHTARKLTRDVLIFAFVVSISVTAVDFGVDKLFKNILLK